MVEHTQCLRSTVDASPFFWVADSTFTEFKWVSPVNVTGSGEFTAENVTFSNNKLEYTFEQHHAQTLQVGTPTAALLNCTFSQNTSPHPDSEETEADVRTLEASSTLYVTTPVPNINDDQGASNTDVIVLDPEDREGRFSPYSIPRAAGSLVTTQAAILVRPLALGSYLACLKTV